jgi:hypothetical protein
MLLQPSQFLGPAYIHYYSSYEKGGEKFQRVSDIASSLFTLYLLLKRLGV